MSDRYSTEICIQCESPFEITDRDWERYETKGFDLPQRCERCRKHKIKTEYDLADERGKDKKKRSRMKYKGSPADGDSWY